MARTVEALAAKDGGIVLLSVSTIHPGDPARNAELAKQRAMAVRDALVAGGVAAERVKFRKPESTVVKAVRREGGASKYACSKGFPRQGEPAWLAFYA